MALNEYMSGNGPIAEWLWMPLMDDMPRHGDRNRRPSRTLLELLGPMRLELVKRALRDVKPKRKRGRRT